MRNLKSELSKKSPYYISKHKNLELYHFCLQYKEWKKELSNINLYGKTNLDLKSNTKNISNPTEKIAIKQMECLEKIELVENTAKMADSEIGNYILIAVTEDLTYEQIKARFDIPCGRDMFYDRRRKFFWLLSKER